jgi:Cu(I)/Ag(I) efflux system periplasmic protein CusF
MKRLSTLLATLVISAPLLAQTPNVEGEVTKIDLAQARVTLKHGEIKNLDMPPMTMVFRVSNPKLLERVAVGDKVRFAAEKVNGSYTVTALVKAP